MFEKINPERFAIVGLLVMMLVFIIFKPLSVTPMINLAKIYTVCWVLWRLFAKQSKLEAVLMIVSGTIILL
jgi:hypothetical protein